MILFINRSYTVLAPTMIRPSQTMRLSATVIKLEFESMTITAAVKRTNHAGTVSESICNGRHTFHRPGAFDITMKVRTESVKFFSIQTLSKVEIFSSAQPFYKYSYNGPQ